MPLNHNLIIRHLSLTTLKSKLKWLTYSCFILPVHPFGCGNLNNSCKLNTVFLLKLPVQIKTVRPWHYLQNTDSYSDLDPSFLVLFYPPKSVFITYPLVSTSYKLAPTIIYMPRVPIFKCLLPTKCGKWLRIIRHRVFNLRFTYS